MTTRRARDGAVIRTCAGGCGLQKRLHPPIGIAEERRAILGGNRPVGVLARQHEQGPVINPVGSRHLALEYLSGAHRELERRAWLGDAWHLDEPREPHGAVVDRITLLIQGRGLHPWDPQ